MADISSTEQTQVTASKPEQDKAEVAITPMETPKTKEHITREHDPEKIEKKKTKYDPVKHKAYRTAYNTKLKERAKNGDQKAIEILKKKSNIILELEARTNKKKSEVQKLNQQKEQLTSVMKQEIEEEVKKAKESIKVPEMPKMPEIPNLVTKDKYKKLKGKILDIQTELQKVKESNKPKYSQDIFNKLFSN